MKELHKPGASLSICNVFIQSDHTTLDFTRHTKEGNIMLMLNRNVLLFVSLLTTNNTPACSGDRKVIAFRLIAGSLNGWLFIYSEKANGLISRIKFYTYFINILKLNNSCY